MTRHLRSVAVAATAALLLGGTTAVSAAAGTSGPITRGNTKIIVDTTSAAAFHNAGVVLRPVAPATKTDNVVKLPATGGSVNLPQYYIHLGGGFKFTDGTTTVSFTNITQRTRISRATADVTGHGNITALVLGDPQRGSGGPGFASFGGYPITLSADAIRALDKAFGTKAFANHPLLGIGDTAVHYTA